MIMVEIYVATNDVENDLKQEKLNEKVVRKKWIVRANERTMSKVEMNGNSVVSYLESIDDAGTTITTALVFALVRADKDMGRLEGVNRQRPLQTVFQIAFD